MKTINNQDEFFQGLGKTIRIGLVTYFLIFCIGTLLTFYKLNVILPFFRDLSSNFYLLLILALAGLFWGLVSIVSKIQWVDRVHIEIDKKCFGFLQKSNEIIFKELLFVLESTERTSVLETSPESRVILTNAILPRFTNMPDVFESLFKSGVFHLWVVYWIALYGTIFFIILIVEAFIMILINFEPHAKLMFTINWSLALFHLAVTLSFGYYLIRTTKRIVKRLVVLHKLEIASWLRTSIKMFNLHNSRD